jgi:hypothetical protein
VNIAAFMRVQQTTRGKGPYVWCLDASKSINILSTPAHATFQRNDLIVAQQTDAFYGDGTNVLTVKQVVGTPSGSPADPAVTGSPDFILLARVRVAANATTIVSGAIDDLRPTAFTVASGGTIPVASLTERAAITAPFTGMVIWRADRFWREVWTGSAWRVMDLVVVTAFSDLATHVTSPFAGQLAYVVNDKAVYQYSGSAWITQFFTGSGVGYARYKHTTLQTILNVTDTKARFQTSVDTCPQVTASGTGNDTFQMNLAGIWSIHTQARYLGVVGTNERHLHLVKSTDTSNTRYTGQTGCPITNAPQSLACSTQRRFAANDQVSALLFQNSGGSVNTDTSFGESFHIALKWEGP